MLFRSRDSLTMRLGEITASNAYRDGVTKTEAGLRGMQLVSTIFYDRQSSTLKMIDDIAIVTEIVQYSDAGIESRPDTEVNMIYEVVVHNVLTKPLPTRWASMCLTSSLP